MPVPTARPRAIKMAWEVHEHPDIPEVKEEFPIPKPHPPKTFTEAFTCEFCGKRFTKTYLLTEKGNIKDTPKWCDEHKTPVSRKTQVCPTPQKKRFPQQQHAMNAALKASKSYAHPVRAYKCQCGMWHITKSRAFNA